MEDGKIYGSANRRKMYDNLSKDGFELGTFEDFNRNMDNKDTRQAIYRAAQGAGWELPEYDQFDRDMTVRQMKIGGEMKEVDHATYDNFMKRHPSGTNVKKGFVGQTPQQAPQQPQQKPKPAAVSSAPKSVEAPESQTVGTPWGSEGSATGKSAAYKPSAPGQVRETGDPGASQFGVPYKPDTEMTAAERDAVYRQNDFAVKQLRQMEREEERRSQPVTDTGNKDVNSHIIKTQGEWEDDLQKGVKRISSSVVVPAVDKAVAEFDKKASEVFEGGRKDSNATGGLPTGTAAGAGIFGNIRESNQAKDPDKILNYLKQQMESVYKDSSFVEEIGREADRMGIDRNEYLENIIKPQIQSDLASRFEGAMISKELPKSGLEYVVNGLSNSIVGMVADTFLKTKSQRAYKNQAEAMTEEGRNPYYSPSTSASLSKIGVTFAADAPFFGVTGRVGGQVAKKFAERQIQNMMAKGLSEGAARSIVGTALENSVGARMKNYIMQHVISSGITMGGFNALSEGARQVRDDEFDPLKLAGSTAEGLATGAAFGLTGGVSQALSQPLSGFAKIGAKAAGFGAEAETMYATEELAKMIQGEEGFTNPFEGSVESLMKLGVMKLSSPGGLVKTIGEIAHPLRSNQAQRTGVNFTKEEEALIRDSAEGKSLLEALSGMHPDKAVSEVNGKKRLTPEGEEMRRKLADSYNAFMENPEYPATVKEKVAAVLGGVYKPGLETGADIVQGDDGSVTLKTRDKDGNCIREMKFDSFEDADQWRNEFKTQMERNDAVNMWNNATDETRQKIVDAVREQISGEKEAAAMLERANGMKQGRMQRELEKLNKFKEEHEGRELTDEEARDYIQTVIRDGSDEVFREMYQTIHDNAYPKDEYNPKRNYEDGRKVDPMERHFAQVDAQLAEEHLSTFGDDFAREVIDADDYADEKMAELATRRGVTKEQIEAARDYYNATARLRGVMDEALKNIDEQVEAANAQIQRNTHPDSGALIEASYDNKDYYVTAGHVQITPDGRLVSSDGTGVVILRDRNTGEIEVMNPQNLTVTSIQDPRRLMEANDSMDGLRGQLMKQADDSIELNPDTPDTPQEMGETFTGADGKLYVVAGEPDGTGNVVWLKIELNEAGDPVGEPQPLDIDEYRKAKSNEIDAAARAEAEALPIEDESTITEPVNGTSATESNISGQNIPGTEEIVTKSGVLDNAGGEASAKDGTGAGNPSATALSRIPVDETGKKLYEQAKPEDTLTDLIEKRGEDKAEKMVGQMVDNISRQISELSKKDMSKVTDMNDIDAYETELSDLQEKLDYWRGISDKIKTEKAKKSWENLVNPKEIRNFATDPEGQQRWVDEHIDEIVDSYIRTHGNLLDPDKMRNAFAGMGYNGKNVTEYREQEGRVVKAIYKRMLSEAVANGNTSITLLTGAGGAGKSTATMQMDLSGRGVVYDSAFNKFKKLDEAIEAAKAAGMTDIQVIAVYNDATTSFSNSVDRGLSTGRFMSLDYFVNGAFLENEGKISQLRQAYPDVEIIAFDNSGNKASERPNGGRVTPEEAEAWDYTLNDAKLNELLDIFENGINEGRFTEDQIASIGRGLRNVTRRIPDLRVETERRVSRIAQGIFPQDVPDLRPGVPRGTGGSGRGGLVPAADGAVQGSSGERPAEGEQGAPGQGTEPAASADGSPGAGGAGQPVVDQRQQKKLFKTAEANTGRTFTFTNSAGVRSELTLQRIDRNGDAVVIRQDYDAQGNPVGDPREERYAAVKVGEAIDNGTWKKDLTSEEHLREVMRNKPGATNVISVFSDGEIEKLWDTYKSGDKEAFASLYDEYRKEHFEDLIHLQQRMRSDDAERTVGYGTREEKVRRLRKIYKDNDDAVLALSDESMQPQTIEEYVADAMGDVPKMGEGFLAYTSYDRGGNKIVGLKDETGFGSRGFGGDTKGFNPWLAPNGSGVSLKQFAEMVHEQLPEGLKEQYSDQDIRNVIYNVMTGAEKPTDIPNMIIRDRMRLAEEAMRREEQEWIDSGMRYQKVSPDGKSFAGRLERAKQQTNTEPTEAQKEAGNYKKGHVSFGGYDFVVENPEGSMRRGKDADGKAWEQKMHNTYGYILGKRGKDGDHLDMFINDAQDLDNWNGTVYVVDQVDPKTGKLDEHKILFGFDSEAEAREAYLSNYEKGWKGLGKITGVDKETFDKWLDSSDRKIKEFSEHSIIKDAVRKAEPEPQQKEATPAERDRTIRDAVVEYLRSKGIEVSDDWELGQRILNEANGKASMENVSEDAIRPQKVEPTFYSNAMKAVEGIKQDKATPEQWLKMIEKGGGLKAGEDKWLGLSDWLKGQDKKSLTKQEVMDYIRQNQIEIEETHYKEHFNVDDNPQMQEFRKEFDELVDKYTKEQSAIDKESSEFNSEMFDKYGAGWANDPDRLSKEDQKRNDDIIDRYHQLWDEDIEELAFKEMVSRYGDDFGMAFEVNYGNGKLDPQMDMYGDELSDAAKYFIDFKEQPINSTRLGYTTEGLDNKREIALTVPTVEPYKEGDHVHFGDADGGRAVAWVRFGETTDADGKKVLVIDEIQSKRHQDAREMGYGDPEERRRIYNEKMSAHQKRIQEIDEKRKAYTKKVTGNEKLDIEGWKQLSQKDKEYLTSLNREKDLLVSEQADWQKKFENENSVPEAPFEKNWHELAMKRMLRYAAENGYDKIAWTTGEQQAERYDLSKQIDEIQAIRNGGGYQIDAIKDGKSIYADFYDNEAKLAEVIGKDLASKIFSNQDTGSVQKYNGLDLKVGGEGMSGFYDQILPRFMDKYGKKWGVKTGEVELPDVEESGRRMHSVDVTPEMREGVMQGQPMFFRTSDGHAYGYTYQGKIYVDPRIATAETPIHEYGHLWCDMKRQTAPEEWNAFKEVMLNDKLVQPIIDKVKRDYPELSKEGREDDFVEEIITQFSGKRGAERLREIADEVARENGGVFGKAEAVTAMQRLKNILNRFWEGVARMMGWKYTNANQIADRIMADMLNGVNPNGKISKSRASGSVRPAKIVDMNAKTVRMAEKNIEDLYTEGLRPADAINMQDRVLNMSPRELIEQYRRVNSQMLDENGLDIDQQEDAFRRKWADEHGWPPAEGSGFGKASADYMKSLADRYTYNKMALRWDLLDRIRELGLEDYIDKDTDELPDVNTAEFVRMRFQMTGREGAAEADRADGNGVRMENNRMAEEMEKAGKDPRAIKLATGWERGKDGQWRYEIPDADVDIIDKYNRKYSEMSAKGVKRPMPIFNLEDLLGKENELLKYYPQLRSMQVMFSDLLPAGTAGTFDGKNIELNAEETARFDTNELNNENVYGTLLHEVQHAIQDIEGFARGGNLMTSTTEEGINAIIGKKERQRADIKTRLDANRKILDNPEELRMAAELDGKTEQEVKDQLEDTVYQQAAEYDNLGLQIERLRHTKAPAMSDARDLYRRLAGEVESRNVTERMGMTGEQRRQSLASETEDVPRDDQVIIMDDGTSMNIKDIKPVGTGDFGEVYDQFKGKPREAVDFLVKKKGGDLLGVFHRDEVGDIDLVWGESHNPYKGKGLSHIIRKHIETLHDFKDIDELSAVLDDVVNNGSVGKNGNNIEISKDGYRVVLAQEDNGKKWVLTAFDNSKTKKEKLSSANTAGTPIDTSGSRAVAADDNISFSEGKDTKNIPNDQEKKQKSSDEAPKFQRTGSPEPEMTPEERQYWNKWDEDMRKWKERNAMPAEATGPGEKPKFRQGESALDFAKRLVAHNREKALWQTAPKLEDYHQKRADKDMLEAAREAERRYPDSPSARMRRIAAEFQQIRHAMSQQKAYDKATVKAVTDFAQDFMRQGFGDNLSRGEMERMLSSVKNATGAKDIRQSVDNIMNILIDNHLRNLDQQVQKLSSTKELSKTAQGVEKQGKLELKGQRMIQAFRKAREGRMDADRLREEISKVAEKMARNDDEAPMWEQDFEGLQIALQYQEDIEASRDEYADLDREYKEAVRDYKDSGRSYKDQQQYLESLDEAMMENKIERIGMFGDIIGRLQGNISESMQGAREFVEREKERVKHIQQIANFDLAGKPADALREKSKGRPANFFLQPLGTFEQMLRQFGSRNANGEGYLYDYFMRNWMEATDKAFLNEQKAKKELDDKAREVFGSKVKRWSDLYDIARSLPSMEVEVLDGENPKTFKLNQGNLLYIYMADKMTDGRMKLRKMGIDEEAVEKIKDFLDPRLVQLGDWLQDEYLVNKRTEYNKVHERMFGAPMAAIDHYFPLKVLGDARYQEQDVNVPDSETLPSTITGNIIKRRKNALPLDILHTDALSLAIEHVEDMERWAAQAEWNKDINTLLSYTTFRNKVKNMDTVYGSGDALWNAFKDTAKMAAGTYDSSAKSGHVDKAISNIAKGVTAAKINFRVYTAFKQLLSAPAFLHDVRLDDFVKNSVNPYGSWKWAMENMPVFQKRWKSRQVGDTRLMDDPTDWKMWKTNIVQMATRLGMSPNALVDGITCAVGARSIYESRYRKYKKIGASDEVARKRALQDAEIGYNLTQQSSEGAFTSAIQKDRTVAANMLSVFRNSSMSYTRQWYDAYRNLKKRTQKGYKEDSIKFMTRQIQEQFDLDEDQAKRAAELEYAREGRRDVARLLNMMFGVTVAWNLGASLPYLLMGDDDNTKKEMMTDALLKGLIAGPTEGFAAGNIWSDLIGRTLASEETRRTIGNEGWGAGIDAALKQGGDYEVNPLPLMADIQSMIKKMGYDKFAAAQDVFNIGVQSAVGVNPQTFTDMWNAAMDYGAPAWDGQSYGGDNDLSDAKEIALFIMRLMNAPSSSWKNKYIDELGMNADDAKKLPYDEMARRYAHYKHWKDAPVMGWLRGEEGRAAKIEKMQQQFDKAVEERMQRLTDDELRHNVARSENAEEKRKYAKLISQRLGLNPGATSSKADEKNWYQQLYQERMDYEDIREDETLAQKLKDYREKDNRDKTRQEVKKRLDWIRNGKYDTPSGRKGTRKKGNEPDLLAPGKRQFSTDGDEKANEAIMKNIRQWRKEALEILMRAESKK